MLLLGLASLHAALRVSIAGALGFTVSLQTFLVGPSGLLLQLTCVAAMPAFVYHCLNTSLLLSLLSVLSCFLGPAPWFIVLFWWCLGDKISETA